MYQKYGMAPRLGLLISPQAWGCTVDHELTTDRYQNLPTGVGLYRARSACLAADTQSPHRRGVKDDLAFDRSAGLEFDTVEMAPGMIRLALEAPYQAC